MEEISKWHEKYGIVESFKKKFVVQKHIDIDMFRETFFFKKKKVVQNIDDTRLCFKKFSLIIIIIIINLCDCGREFS